MQNDVEVGIKIGGDSREAVKAASDAEKALKRASSEAAKQAVRDEKAVEDARKRAASESVKAFERRARQLREERAERKRADDAELAAIRTKESAQSRATTKYLSQLKMIKAAEGQRSGALQNVAASAGLGGAARAIGINRAVDMADAGPAAALLGAASSAVVAFAAAVAAATAYMNSTIAQFRSNIEAGITNPITAGDYVPEFAQTTYENLRAGLGGGAFETRGEDIRQQTDQRERARRIARLRLQVGLPDDPLERARQIAIRESDFDTNDREFGQIAGIERERSAQPGGVTNEERQKYNDRIRKAQQEHQLNVEMANDEYARAKRKQALDEQASNARELSAERERSSQKAAADLVSERVKSEQQLLELTKRRDDTADAEYQNRIEESKQAQRHEQEAINRELAKTSAMEKDVVAALLEQSRLTQQRREDERAGFARDRDARVKREQADLDKERAREKKDQARDNEQQARNILIEQNEAASERNQLLDEARGIQISGNRNEFERERDKRKLDADSRLRERQQRIWSRLPSVGIDQTMADLNMASGVHASDYAGADAQFKADVEKDRNEKKKRVRDLIRSEQGDGYTDDAAKTMLDLQSAILGQDNMLGSLGDDGKIADVVGSVEEGNTILKGILAELKVGKPPKWGK